MWLLDVILLWRHNCAIIWMKSANRCDVGPLAIRHIYSHFCVLLSYLLNLGLVSYDVYHSIQPYHPLSMLHKQHRNIRGWIKKFWNYSHISLNIRQNYIKLTQNTELTFPHFAMTFEWRNTQGEMWRHRLMTSYNRDLVRKMTEIFLSKWKTMTNIYMSFGEFFF